MQGLALPSSSSSTSSSESESEPELELEPESSLSGKPTRTIQNMEEMDNKPWSLKEDVALRQLVYRYGNRNWSLISCYIPRRSSKSCQLRWYNHLSPTVPHRLFSHQENEIILAAQAIYGDNWDTIAKLLQGRTYDVVKNHWNSTLMSKRRLGFNPRFQELQTYPFRVDSGFEHNPYFEVHNTPRLGVNSKFSLNHNIEEHNTSRPNTNSGLCLNHYIEENSMDGLNVNSKFCLNHYIHEHVTKELRAHSGFDLNHYIQENTTEVAAIPHQKTASKSLNWWGKIFSGKYRYKSQRV